MPTKEMLIVLETLESIKQNGTVGSIHKSGLGFVTSEEVLALEGIAGREGGLGSIMRSLVDVLELPEGHPDLPSHLAKMAGVFLAWSLNSSQPLEESRFSPGDKVRVRFPGKSLVYLGTVVEEEGRDMIAIPLLGTVVEIKDLHIQEKVAKEKPKATEVAAFQRLLEGKLEEILQNVEAK